MNKETNKHQLTAEMCEEQQFDFGDFNLKFLELTPPRSSQYTPTALKCGTPITNPSTESRQVLSSRLQDLAKRIANNDSLIQQLKNLQKERKELQQQLKDFQSSAKDISKLYEAEKLERKNLQRRTSELHKKCETLTSDLASITFANDQLGGKLEETNHLPVDYNDLSACYMRLYSKLEKDQAQHWHDQAIAKKIRKYCVEKSLFVPEKCSPKKRKPKIKKPEIGIQCELSNATIASTVQIKKEMRSQATQHVNIELRSQGTQHISTTTTRSTCTSSFIKKHNVGTCFPEPQPMPPIDDMLREMLRWDIKPVSPIPTNVILEPLVRTKKSTGTCTFICNIQRTIDYIGGHSESQQLFTNVKHSNSRPPSRNISDRIKNEVLTPPPSTPPTMHSFEPNVASGFPQLSSSLNTLNFSTFDDLWQVFGQMLFGLLKNRSNDGLSSTRPLGGTGGNPINLLEFQNWLRLMYEDISEQNTVVAAAQSNNLELLEFRNDTSTNKDVPVHQSIGTSPMRFRSSIEGVDSSFSTSEEFFYPETFSTGILPNLDGTELTKIHIPAKSNNKIIQKIKRKKCSKYQDAIVNEILDLFPHLERTKEKKIKIAKLLKNQNKSNSTLQKKLTTAEEQYITTESPSKLSENAVDFLTQFSSTVNETNNALKYLPTEQEIFADNNTINQNILNGSNKKNKVCETKKLLRTKENQKLTSKLANSLFGSDTDDTSFESDSETDEAVNSNVNVTKIQNIHDEDIVKEDLFVDSMNKEDCLIEKHDFKKEVSLNDKESKCYDETLEDSTICDAVSDLKFAFGSDVNYLDDINENNLISDEFYDASSSQIEISTINAPLQYNCSISPIKYNIDKTENSNRTISPIINSNIYNDKLTAYTNQIVENLVKNDPMLDSINGSNFENQLQKITTDIKPLNLSPVSLVESTSESSISSDVITTLQNPSSERKSKRNIDIYSMDKEDCLIENHTFKNETSFATKGSNIGLLLSTTNINILELCKDRTGCDTVSELKFSTDIDANYTNDLNENNLIIDEFYDAGSSEIEISTTNASLQCNSIDETENHNRTISPIFNSNIFNGIHTSTNQKYDVFIKSDSLLDNINGSNFENHLQQTSADIKPLNSLPVPVKESTFESFINSNLAPTLNNPSSKRGSKRKIDICRSPTTSLFCKQSACSKAMGMTPLGKYTSRNHYCKKQLELRESSSESKQLKQFHTEEKNNLSLEIGFFNQRNTDVNCDYRANVKRVTATKFEQNNLSLQENYQQLTSSLRDSIKQQNIELHRKMGVAEAYLSYYDTYNTSSSHNNDFPNKLDVAFQEKQSIQKTTYDDFESPASPLPPPSIEENNFVESSINTSTKEIPLEIDKTHYSFDKSILQRLCKNYNNKMHGIVIAQSSSRNSISKTNQKQISNLNLKIQEFLTTTTIESELDLASFVLVQQMQEITNNNITRIASVIVEQMQDVPRPETELGCKIADIPPKYLGKLHRKISYVMRRLQLIMPQFSAELLGSIESKLFNFKAAAKLSLSIILNLTQLYLLTISNQLPQMQRNPARLFIYKCLYFYNLRAIPLIYEVLCCFPTTLPHREDRTYDDSDALVNVIQHILMCTKYDMDKIDLRTKELLSKLRFEYHFEPFKPDREDILNNLLKKIETGKLENVSYAFALLCKRQPQSKVETDILRAKLLPLTKKFYQIALNSVSHDAQISCLLESISMIIKAFALDTDISAYSKLFARFLNAVERPTIQEAAVQAILRIQRFGCLNCYNELLNFKPNYELQPMTRAMLQTFIYRKPSVFWKNLYAESTTVTE